MEHPEFLTRGIIDQLHADSLHNFGGSAGLRDEGMILSALGSAENTWLYAIGDLFEVAASYAFHIAEAQAFVDGNKRTAVATAMTFLTGNGVEIPVAADEVIYQAMIAIANKHLDKKGLAELLSKAAEAK
ncbi:MAG: type II toxin-antitoxin system death-on-curing family toxin [Verrucomicrobiota bacterium]